MHTDVVRSAGAVLALVLMFSLALFLLVWPLGRRYPDDQGDGMALVKLPPPKIPSHLRTIAFVTVFVALNVLYHSMRGNIDLNTIYADAVTRLSDTAVAAPAELQGFFFNFSLGLRALVVATILALALTARGNGLRRILLVAQVGWYLLAVLLFDSVLTVVSVVFDVPLSPSTVLANLAALGLGFLALVRMLFVNFALPKPTAVHFVSRKRLGDAATLVGCTVAAVAVSTAATLALYHSTNPKLRVLFGVLAPIPFAYSATILRSIFLFALAKLTLPRSIPIGDEKPLIEVIIPAYNEEEVIEATLRSIDVAAGRYGGPVNVILANDGSTDRTYEIGTATIAAMRYATGRIINVRHGGKSATLNSALGETTADLVVRIDADTIIGEAAFYHLPRSFRDPEVGLVEALMWPQYRRSPFPRMRLFEELKQFGMLHRTVEVVDGINVVPGVFTAFRRQPAVDLGGFTVGMNGEDGDFTMRMSRLGWKIRMDPQICIYEDVPPTYMEIREQRIRWDRASIHNQARHGSYRAGIATPKVWFSQTHQFYTRVFAPVRLVLPFYLLIYAAFEGSYRTPVLLFLAGWFVGSAGFVALELFLTLAYRQERRFLWVLIWPLWQYMLIMFSTEAWLSLPARPASFLHGSRPPEIAAAVVH